MKMNTRTIKTACGKVAMLAMVGTLALGAGASSVTIDSVSQRWPWNNNVDITYTVDGGQILSADGTADTYARIVFSATIAGETYTIDGVHDLGANASNGTHTVTWTPPANLTAKDLAASMTATLYSADNPSGDDYMIVDLSTGEVSYEGLLYSQALSNARYNTATYKNQKMVLRKIPRWADKGALPNASALTGGGYPTGHSDYPDTNSPTNWVTKYDYYIGVFPMTRDQRKNYFGPTSTLSGTFPAGRTSWNRVRGNSSADPTQPVGASSDTTDGGSICAQLNYKVQAYQSANCKNGVAYSFDLPTEVMWEIAARAGATTVYAWGNKATDGADYAVCNNNKNNITAVGTYSANAWGLFDMFGNAYDMCLDDDSLANLADASDPFTAAYGGISTQRQARGDYYAHALSQPGFKASNRQTVARDKGDSYAYTVRLAVIMK